MISLPGYQITETVALDRRLRPGSRPSANTPTPRTAIYRGYRLSDRRPVVIKTTASTAPALTEIARLRHEYDIITSLDSPYIIRAYGLETFAPRRIAAIYEDIGGQSLDRAIPEIGGDLLTCLDIAIQLTKALQDLHQAKIVHKDIKPPNIIYNPQSGQVKLTDFGIASRLSQERPTAVAAVLDSESSPFQTPLTQLEGTLAYLSPEQTGRTNRLLDYRTDFYSLGVTLYELLTGQLPFICDDALELVHCHIAKVPTPPQPIQPDIPTPVSDLVMKLLAKSAEDRYQSAFGLLSDLETCRHKLQERGKIPSFTLGQHDVSAQLQIPAKLYGREAEVKRLTAAVERTCNFGSRTLRDRPTIAPDFQGELVLVSGYSGVGKSALVREIHRPLARRRGYFASGKFERLKRNLPYFAFRQALSEAVAQLLAESRPRLESARRRLQRTLGTHTGRAVELIPELAPLLPSDNNPTELPAHLNHEVFCQLVTAFAQPEHPLVLFLDDLQWADNASLKLVGDLLLRGRDRPLLIVGAYRDNEITPSHPLALALEDWQQRGIVPEYLALRALGRSCVEALVADTLHLSTEEVRPLADLVYRKTDGNPFFLTQLLSSLVRDELLVFDGAAGRWRWDMEQLDAIEICENVIDLTVRKLQTLPRETQNLLMLAACIGNRFDLNVLSVVNERSPRRTAADLWDAIRQGTLIPIGEAYKIPLALEADGETEALDAAIAELPIAYKFLHDRVQQAAYALISPEIRQDVRVQIGRLLLKSTPPEALEDRIFEIVNQFNAGASLMVRPDEKRQLAQLNLLAARKAKATAADRTASDYLDVGRTALGDDGWQTEYELTFALHIEAIEVEAAVTRFERAEVLARTALDRARTPIDRARVQQRQVRFYSVRGDTRRAIDTGLTALVGLGLDLQGADVETPLTAVAASDRPLEDERLRLVLQLLDALAAAAAFGDVSVLRRAVSRQLQLSQQSGYALPTAFAYIWAVALMGEARTPDTLQTAVDRAEAVFQHFKADAALRGRLRGMVAARLSPWFHPLTQTLPNLREAVLMSRDGSTSDMLLEANTWDCGLGALTYCSQAFWGESTLDRAGQSQNLAVALLEALPQSPARAGVWVWRQLVANLQGDVSQPQQLVGSYANTTVESIQARARGQRGIQYYLHLAQLVLAVVLDDEDGALAAADAVEAEAELALGAVDRFYQLAYCLLVNLRDCKTTQISPRLEAQYESLVRLGAGCAENFQSLLALVAAERSRVAGQVMAAMEEYDRAIDCGKQFGRWADVALANERAAVFYEGLGRETIARLYWQEAQRHYQVWGATAKVQVLANRLRSVKDLTQADGTLAEVEPLTHALGETVLETAVARPSEVLDRVTAIKATHALSSEIVLESLLAKLIEIVLENAGAQTGFLILTQDDRLIVEAMGTVTTERVSVRQGIPVELCESLPHSVIYYVARRRESVALDDAAMLDRGSSLPQTVFASDPYIQRYRPRSLLCAPIERQGKLVGVLYLENNLTAGAFTRDRLDLLGLLCSQAAISIENATLYQNLQASERRERDRAEQLQRSLEELEQAQVQLIQSEKMSALGQLMAGIAHEINNPIGFIVGNLTLADNYIQDCIEHLQLYRDRFPEPDEEILEHAEDIDIEYLMEDAPKLMASMQVGVDRIREISKALRTFARADADKPVRTDLHDSLNSTLLILKHRLKATDTRPAVEVVKQYGNLPLVECFAGQLNQVFTNLIANAIDAVEEGSQDKSFQELQANPNQITLTTRLSEDGHWAIVRVADNGIGMPEEVRSQIFDRCFTTKGVGKGTGLGLSICQQIVEVKHGGSIRCQSQLGQGTEFEMAIPVTLSVQSTAEAT